MSKITAFESANTLAGDTRFLEVGDYRGTANLIISRGSERLGVCIPEPTVPALALCILETIIDGQECISKDLADAKSALRREVKRLADNAKEAADREALERRRDEVSNELCGGTVSYKMCNNAFQNAINRIIELEDQATK